MKHLEEKIKFLKESRKALKKKVGIYEDMLKEEVDDFNPQSKDYTFCKA